MAQSIKDRIKTDLQQARDVGQLRSDRVREIFRTAVAQISSELKTGAGELRTLIKDAFSTAVVNLQDNSTEAKEQLTASVEGIIEGIRTAGQQKISDTEAEVKRLQAQLMQEEQQLEQQVEHGLEGIQDAAQEGPANLREQIEAAIANAQNSEEVSLLKRRYAQLQAQAAILQAALAARTETYYDRAREHLEDAKQWYSQSRPKLEATKEQADQRITQLEERIGEAGVALARREKQVRQLLSELLHRAAEVVRESETEKPTAGSLPPRRDHTD